MYWVALFIGLAMLAMFSLMVADLGMPGLQQRIFIFLFLLWLSIVVHKSVRLTALTNSLPAQVAYTDQ
jgi:hypothetical protein